ncbi:hypothetical protein ICW40_08745 [Actinotalea ferrariae]|uniref:aromatic acid exporter family protein n=1 Tax=Actinotalea ferrariae TaxID=1386098 RepID=UPI001C8CEFC1|nr:aromatic acid exporter family protein [Actinotalea ferrariae]MBX9244898.1 hypothetical protein [Actinotalea ferrariae]
MREPRRAPGELLRRALHHPRTGLAVKAALAATLAWLVALRLPPPAGDYPYYAPLGAVVAMYPAVLTSVRESLQSTASIALGAAIALTVDALVGFGAFVVAVVVLLGVLVGGLRQLGAQRAYVPTSALFVLIIGGQNDVAYAAAYAGNVLLGASIAIAVNAAFPSLPLARVDDALADLRDALQAHLHHLALRFADPSASTTADDGTPAADDLDRSDLDRRAAAAREVVHGARDSVRANRRASRHPDAVTARDEAFRALDRVVLLVDDLYELLADAPWGHDLQASPEELREPASRALAELAVVVADVGVRDPDPARRATVDTALAELTAAVRRGEARGTAEAELLVMSTITTTLRRCLSVVSPPDQLASSPS